MRYDDGYHGGGYNGYGNGGFGREDYGRDYGERARPRGGPRFRDAGWQGARGPARAPYGDDYNRGYRMGARRFTAGHEWREEEEGHAGRHWRNDFAAGRGHVPDQLPMAGEVDYLGRPYSGRDADLRPMGLRDQERRQRYDHGFLEYGNRGGHGAWRGVEGHGRYGRDYDYDAGFRSGGTFRAGGERTFYQRPQPFWRRWF